MFLDGKELVILGTSGHELVRMPGVEHPEDLAEAFQNHGYPWSADGDPFKDRYRRWVPDLPELPPSANALLKARERALKEKNKKDIAELREELAKIGYIVRDEGINQYWRPVDVPDFRQFLAQFGDVFLVFFFRALSRAFNSALAEGDSGRSVRRPVLEGIFTTSLVVLKRLRFSDATPGIRTSLGRAKGVTSSLPSKNTEATSRRGKVRQLSLFPESPHGWRSRPSGSPRRE